MTLISENEFLSHWLQRRSKSHWDFTWDFLLYPPVSFEVECFALVGQRRLRERTKVAACNENPNGTRRFDLRLTEMVTFDCRSEKMNKSLYMHCNCRVQHYPGSNIFGRVMIGSSECTSVHNASRPWCIRSGMQNKSRSENRAVVSSDNIYFGSTVDIVRFLALVEHRRNIVELKCEMVTSCSHVTLTPLNALLLNIPELLQQYNMSRIAMDPIGPDELNVSCEIDMHLFNSLKLRSDPQIYVQLPTRNQQSRLKSELIILTGNVRVSGLLNLMKFQMRVFDYVIIQCVLQQSDSLPDERFILANFTTHPCNWGGRIPSPELDQSEYSTVIPRMRMSSNGIELSCIVSLPEAIQKDLLTWSFHRGFEVCNAMMSLQKEGGKGNLVESKMYWCRQVIVENFQIRMDTELMEWMFLDGELYCEVSKIECNLLVESKIMQEQQGYSELLSPISDSFAIMHNPVAQYTELNGQDINLTCAIELNEASTIQDLSLLGPFGYPMD